VSAAERAEDDPHRAAEPRLSAREPPAEDATRTRTGGGLIGSVASDETALRLRVVVDGLMTSLRTRASQAWEASLGQVLAVLSYSA